MKRDWLSPPMLKLLVIVAAVGGLLLAMYLMSGLPRPREADRTWSANRRFSIIIPRGYESRLTLGDASTVTVISATPKTYSGFRPELLCGQFREAPSMAKLEKAGFVPGKFQSRDAMIFAGMVKRLYVWRTIFQSDGDWFEVSVQLPLEENVPQSDWWPYLNSFQSVSAATTQSN